MADVRPLRGIRYNPEHIRLGGVLAPPYDVLSDADREELYGRDLRNIVRIDSGLAYPDDVPGSNDVYTRAAGHLAAWLKLGILLRDEEDAFFVTSHEFSLPEGGLRRRLGLYARVAAKPWSESPMRPHERTLRGPKEDRLQLMRATRTQTSAVFGMWDSAPGLDALFATIMGREAIFGGRTDGEFGSEKHLVWRVGDRAELRSISEALRSSQLYIADGHHRYETTVAYAEERRAAGDGDGHADWCLVYLCSADDPGMSVLPTHRLVRPRDGMPATPGALDARLSGSATVVPVETVEEAFKAAALRAATHHAFAVQLRDGCALVATPRRTSRSPREGLDVVALENAVLVPLGIDAAAIAEGALAYTRSAAEVSAAVASGAAAMGIGLNPTGVNEVTEVADAGEVMPQKSTYFYPKVPTGVVLNPV